MEWMIMPYRRYADFSGRSRRREYWMFGLFYWGVTILLAVPIIAGFDAEQGFSPVGTLALVALVLFVLGSFIPALAVCVRRFHDQDKTGWLLLLQFLPYIGPIIVMIFMLLSGTSGPNRFGPDPKDPYGSYGPGYTRPF